MIKKIQKNISYMKISKITMFAQFLVRILLNLKLRNNKCIIYYKINMINNKQLIILKNKICCNISGVFKK